MKPSLIRRFFRFVFSHSLRWFNQGLHILECAFPDPGERSLRHVPVFIIGAPRSGSTLLCQALTEYYDFGYLSNLHCYFYGAPSLVERLVRPLKWHRISDYTSTYGRVRGWTAPSECGEFWYRFFQRKPQYVPLEEADPKKMCQLRAAIYALGNAFGKPVLFKNMPCALRLVPIAHALPEALFVVIRRCVIDNAHSLLKVRHEMYGDYACWWSMEPPAIEKLKDLPPHEQVVEQIRHIYALIENDREMIGSDRFIDVQYEEFCNDAHSTLVRLDQFFRRNGVQVGRRAEVPKSFERRVHVRIDFDVYERLVQYVRGE